MIIFNTAALITLIISAIIVAPLYYFFDFMEGSTETWIFGATGFVIGGIVEMSGLKPRLFFIPVWLVGIAILIFQFFDSFGWLGLGLSLGSLVLLGLLLGIYGYRIEKSEWANATETFESAKVALLEEDRILLWQRLFSTFFVPGIMNFKPAMAAHDEAVLAFVLEHLGEELSEEGLEQAQALQKYLHSFQQAEGKFDLKIDRLSEFKEQLAELADPTQEDEA
ncbi:MAG: hypothetical protein JRH20_08970 [Deltaproteobacteria bacterium]|nr:hypothetical protein [Deltaproteobacteria bacterium]